MFDSMNNIKSVSQVRNKSLLAHFKSTCNSQRKNGQEYIKDLSAFEKVVDENIVILSKVIKKDLVIPQFNEFCQDIEDMYIKCKQNQDGQVASYSKYVVVQVYLDIRGQILQTTTRLKARFSNSPRDIT